MTSETKQVWSIDVLSHVRVEVPVGVEVDSDRAVELAMSAVTQFHEVDCGDSVGHIRWAGIHADVEDSECEVIESPGGRNGEGAGRKPGRHGAKVTLATRVSEDVKAFLESTGNASQTVDDRTVRKTKAFREWIKARD